MADDLARRLQAVLRTVGALGSEVHECGPFTVLVDRDDPLVRFNYAVPREPVGGDLSAELAALRDLFARVDGCPGWSSWRSSRRRWPASSSGPASRSSCAPRS